MMERLSSSEVRTFTIYSEIVFYCIKYSVIVILFQLLEAISSL